MVPQIAIKIMLTKVNFYSWALLVLLIVASYSNEQFRPLNYLQGNLRKRSISVWCTVIQNHLAMQVQKAVAKAMQTLSMMKRSFNLLSRDISCPFVTG